MTLQQLKYAILIAETGTFVEAARRLYISQPTLSFAVKELEEELNITIFTRSNKGVAVTKVGEEFLKSAKQIVLQTELLEEKFANKPEKQRYLSVSTQHYTFASTAFAELVNRCGDIAYDLILYETKTAEVIEDVKNLRSELGIIHIGKDNEPIINKILQDSRLTFAELFVTHPYILVGSQNPLALRERVNVSDLAEYPCISFIQNDLAPTFFSEEVINILEQKRSIRISDRGALADLLARTDAYVVSTGVYSASKQPRKIVAVPLDADDSNITARVGMISHKDTVRSSIGEMFCNILEKTVSELGVGAHTKKFF